MVTNADRIQYLYPNAVPFRDFAVDESGKLVWWKLQENRPTDDEIAAVTDSQVVAASTSLYPYELLSLLRPDQVIALQTSTEPIIIILRSKLQTIVIPMPMAGVEMQQALSALVAFGIITEAESQKLQLGETLQ